MDRIKAQAYLDKTECYEMIERALKRPMPEYIREKREEAKKVLEKEGREPWKTSSKQ